MSELPSVNTKLSSVLFDQPVSRSGFPCPQAATPENATNISNMASERLEVDLTVLYLPSFCT